MIKAGFGESGGEGIGNEFDENGNYIQKTEIESSNTEKEYSSEELEEIAKLIEELDDLLAKIVETGAALDPAILQAMRQRVAQIFKKLGVDDAFDPRYLSLKMAIDCPAEYVKLKIDYPTLADFRNNFIIMAEMSKELREFDCTVDPDLDTFIKYARVDTAKLRASKLDDLIKYLYDLGKMLCNSLSYQDIIKDGDLTVRADWSIATGRHRTAVLKTLGHEFCNKNDLYKWIKPKLESDSVFCEKMT